jgi:hypothetical protein
MDWDCLFCVELQRTCRLCSEPSPWPTPWVSSQDTELMREAYEGNSDG